jgi:hypothetical protein
MWRDPERMLLVVRGFLPANATGADFDGEGRLVGVI